MITARPGVLRKAPSWIFLNRIYTVIMGKYGKNDPQDIQIFREKIRQKRRNMRAAALMKSAEGRHALPGSGSSHRRSGFMEKRSPTGLMRQGSCIFWMIKKSILENPFIELIRAALDKRCFYESIFRYLKNRFCL